MKDQGATLRFSLLRFSIVLSIAVLAFGLGQGRADAPRVLFALGMVLLAVFAGAMNPLGSTPPKFRPKGWLEWSAVWAAIAGSVLVIFSAALSLG